MNDSKKIFIEELNSYLNENLIIEEDLGFCSTLLEEELCVDDSCEYNDTIEESCVGFEVPKPKVKKSTKLPDWFKDIQPTFQKKLFKLIDSKNLKDADVYKKAEVDKRLFSKIRSKENYKPKKSTVIQLCFGLELEIDDALDLLSSAGYTLSFSSKEDLIVRFYLEKKNYDILDLNETLYEYDLKPLFE